MYAQDIEVHDTHIRTVQLVANEDIYAPPIIRLGSDESVELSFDELSHEYRRYVYVVTHCNADGTPSRLAESQYSPKPLLTLWVISPMKLPPEVGFLTMKSMTAPTSP